MFNDSLRIKKKKKKFNILHISIKEHIYTQVDVMALITCVLLEAEGIQLASLACGITVHVALTKYGWLQTVVEDSVLHLETNLGSKSPKWERLWSRCTRQA